MAWRESRLQVVCVAPDTPTAASLVSEIEASELLGASVSHVATPERALRTAGDNRPDCIVYMADRFGTDAAEFCRRLEATGTGCPVIVYSSEPRASYTQLVGDGSVAEYVHRHEVASDVEMLERRIKAVSHFDDLFSTPARSSDKSKSTGEDDFIRYEPTVTAGLPPHSGTDEMGPDRLGPEGGSPPWKTNAGAFVAELGEVHQESDTLREFISTTIKRFCELPGVDSSGLSITPPTSDSQTEVTACSPSLSSPALLTQYQNRGNALESVWQAENLRLWGHPSDRHLASDGGVREPQTGTPLAVVDFGQAGIGVVEAASQHPEDTSPVDYEFLTTAAAGIEQYLSDYWGADFTTDPPKDGDDTAVVDNELISRMCDAIGGIVWVGSVPGGEMLATSAHSVELEPLSGGMSVDEFRDQAVAPQDRDRISSSWEALCAGEEGEISVTVRAAEDIEEVTYLNIVAAVDDPDDPERVIAMVTDVTTSQKRYDQLQESNTRLEKFRQVVGHDMRNPLNVAAGRIELAAMEAESNGVGEHLEKAEAAVDEMQSIIDDLTAYAEGRACGPDSGEWCSLERLVKESVEMVPGDLADVSHSCGGAEVRGVRQQLRRITENLLQNAIDHGEDHPVSVEVGILDNGDGFYIADDGPGIPPDKRSEIFEPGFTTTDDGTGLGLDIVSTFATDHGWSVTVTESSDGGARFEISDVNLRLPDK